MRHKLLGLVLGLSLQAAIAAPASEASIQELLEVTRAEALLDGMYKNVDQLVRQGLAKEVQGRKLSDEQRQVMDLAPSRVAELMRREFSWSVMRPIYSGIYQEAFTQSEIDGLIRFYRSPEGQAFISKMPLVMQRSMEVMQMQMQSLMPKVQGLMEQIVREAKLPPKS